jgi:hypothetical protein
MDRAGGPLAAEVQANPDLTGRTLVVTLTPGAPDAKGGCELLSW